MTVTNTHAMTEAPATGQAPRRGRPRDARCDQAILQATLDMLAEGGAAHLSIDAVAARAGVGKATIYRRWSSKEALLLEALGSTDTSLVDSPDTGRLRTDLEAYFDALLERLSESEGSDILPHLIEAACYDPEVRASLDGYLSSRQQPLRAILQRAQQRGEIGSDVDIKVVGDLLVGPVIYRRLMTGDAIDRAFTRRLLDVVITPAGLCS
jgi:AcrR family transcriptional regulator